MVRVTGVESETATGLSYTETPAFFPAAGETLFGVLTAPTTEPAGVTVVLLPGGGRPLATNRNGFSVRVARQLAGAGFHTFRFDYHGAGESTGKVERFRLDEPFVEDVRGAAAWLASRGLRTLILVGSCFGARTALSSAGSIGTLAGLVLISPPTRDIAMGERHATRAASEWTLWGYARRALRPSTLAGVLNPRTRHAYRRFLRTRWRRRGGKAAAENGGGASREHFLAPLRDALARQIPVLFIYGDAEDLYAEFLRERGGALGEILDAAPGLVDIRTLSGRVHGFTSLAAQDGVLTLLETWLRQRLSGDP